MTAKNKPVILLNPPYRKKVLRDYYCSTFPKAPYYWQPIDLLSAAAALNTKADTRLIDAPARRLTPGQVKKTVDELDPQAIFILVSTLTRERDLALACRLKKPGRRIVIGGEVALDPGFDFNRYGFVDGLLLDFTDTSAVGFLAGEAPAGRIRTPRHDPDLPLIGQRYSIGLMPHHLLDGGRYRMPLWRGGFHSLLTNFGCPFDCAFCNSGRQTIGFKLRETAEVAQEAKALKRLGAEKIFIKDMTFGADRAHAEKVLSVLAPYGFRLRGYLRADLVTPLFVRQLKESGFELAQIGVESPLEDNRTRLRKKIGDSVIVNAFQLLRREGINAGAHFIVGVKEDHAATVGACVRQARALGAAYCSINMYQHRMGTSALPAISGWRKKLLSVGATCAMADYNIRRQINYLRTSP